MVSAEPQNDSRQWQAKLMPEIHEGQLYGMSILEGVTVSLDQDGPELYVRVRETDGNQHEWHLNGYDNPGPAELESGDYVIEIKGSTQSLTMDVRKPGWSGSLERAFMSEPTYQLSFGFNSRIRPADGTNSVTVSIGSNIGKIFHSEINTRPPAAEE